MASYSELNLDLQITEILKRDENNSFISCKAIYIENGKEVPTIINAYSNSLMIGDTIHATGTWIKTNQDPKFQNQNNSRFKISFFTYRYPKNKKELSIWFRKILPDIDEKILNNFLENNDFNVLEYFKQKPEDLGDFLGIPSEKALSAWKQNTDLILTTEFLHKNSFIEKNIYKIVEFFFNKRISYNHFLKNPFILMEYGYDIEMCNKILENIGEQNNDFTHKKIIVGNKIMSKFFNESSSTGITVDNYKKSLSEKMDIEKDDINNNQILTSFNKTIIPIKNEEYIVDKTLFKKEEKIANKLAYLLNKDDFNQEKKIENIMEMVFKQKKFEKLDEVQKIAVKMAIVERVAIITGGPGTGKSTIMEAISTINELIGKGPLFLVAPTGMASKRLSQTTKKKATTGHHLLKATFNADGGFSFTVNMTNLLPKGSSVMVDESSIMDIYLMDGILDALPDDAQIIFIGDKNQLPSVGPGNILADMLKTLGHDGKYVLPIVELKKIYRQAKDSAIAYGARDIQDGKIPNLPEKMENGLQFISSSPGKIGNNIINVVKSYQDNGLDPFREMLVACPQKKGMGGTDELNKMLSSFLNPNGKIIPGISKTPFDSETLPIPRVGDRVMMTKNNSKNDTMNGETGTITNSFQKGKQYFYTVTYDDGKEISYPCSEWRTTILAYASTIHKLQGSQGKLVILPVSSTTSENMLYRNLIYTGWTRAEDKLILVGDKETFSKAIMTLKDNERTTLLSTFLSEIKIERKHKNWKEEAEEINKKISNDNVSVEKEKIDEEHNTDMDTNEDDQILTKETKEKENVPHNPFKGFVKQKISTSRNLPNNQKGP